MNLNLLLRKLKRNVQDWGWGAALSRSAAHLLSPIFQRTVYTLYAIDLDAAPSMYGLDQGDFDFVLLDSRQHFLIEQVEECAEWLEGEVRNRLAAGGLCLAAVKGGRLVGFNLIAFNEAYIPLVRLKRKFRPGTAWSEHIAVHRDFRRFGLGKALRVGIFDELRARGTHKLYGGTLRTNEPALALARSLGFRELADVTYLRVLFWKTWRYQRCKRAVALALT